MLADSRRKLREIYSYDILATKYRNIVAVASIYEYLKDGRTHSLDINGSDEGAYNKFEREIRLNKIITNTDIIIQKLDVVIENQQELASVMSSATKSIDKLVSSTDKLNASVELSNYRQEQISNELHYMNMMNSLHIYN